MNRLPLILMLSACSTPALQGPSSSAGDLREEVTTATNDTWDTGTATTTAPVAVLTTTTTLEGAVTLVSVEDPVNTELFTVGSDGDVLAALQAWITDNRTLLGLDDGTTGDTGTAGTTTGGTSTGGTSTGGTSTGGTTTGGTSTGGTSTGGTSTGGTSTGGTTTGGTSTGGTAPDGDVTTLVELRRADHGTTTLVTFTQTYNGHPVFGSGARLTVGLDGSRAISVAGQVVDEARDLDGLTNGLDERTARLTLADLFEEARGEIGYELDDLQLVAVPELDTMAWKGWFKAGNDSGIFLIDAVYGGSMWQGDELPPPHGPNQWAPLIKDIEVNAHGTWDPLTTGYGTYDGMTGVPHGDCWDDQGWENCWLRMGNARLRVMDWNDDPDTQPTVHTTFWKSIFDGSIHSHFNGTPGADDFDAQDQFHKAHEVLRRFDPKRKLAGGWDYNCGGNCDENVLPPLHVMAEVNNDMSPGCSDQTAAFYSFNYASHFAGEDLSDLELDYEGVWAIASCTDNPGHLFHEVGHYIDTNSTYGKFHSGNHACGPGPGESVGLSETVPDLVAIIVGAQVYDLSPNLEEAVGADCGLGALGLTTYKAHDDDPDCDITPRLLSQDRPSADPGCDKTDGYYVASMQQAFLEFVTGSECTGNSCTDINGEPADLIAPLLYALDQGNVQGYEDFVQHMYNHLANNADASEAERFKRIMFHHGIDW